MEGVNEVSSCADQCLTELWQKVTVLITLATFPNKIEDAPQLVVPVTVSLVAQ